VSATAAEGAATEVRGASAASPNDLLDAALRYAQAGYKIIPVRRGSKLPLTPHGAHDATSDVDEIGTWWGMTWRGAGIGLVLDGLVVVDVDPRNGGDVATLPHRLPDTCTAKTGGGGWHYLFRCTNGTRYPGQIAPGVDCKSGPGAYIVVEPSLHPSGASYCWVDESEPWKMQPTAAPAWLGQVQPKAERPNGKAAEGARNSTLTSLAGVMRREGMTPEALEAALLAENTRRCDPPLDDEEVRRIAHSVSRYEPATKAANTPPQEWPSPLDLAELGRTEPQPPRHIIEPWFPEGEVTLLSGHGGACKSYIALELSACLGLGKPWCGLPTGRRRVVYVALEDGRDVLHWRLRRICTRLGASLADLAGALTLIDASHAEAEMVVETRDGPVLTGAYEWVRELMRESQVLVIDGASDAYGASEIVRRHVRYYIRALRRLIPQDGAVLVLAHVDKASAKNAETTQGYSGSTAWNNSVRARWYLRNDGEDGGLLLELAKANHAQAGAQIRLRWDPVAMLPVADAVPAAGGVVKAIRERQERDGIVAAIKACTAAGVDVPAATSGRRTAFNVLSVRPEFPESLRNSGSGSRVFWLRIEELRQMRLIREESIRRKNRHYRDVFVASTEGRAECAE
jgi:hypothetical protein